MPGKVQGIEEKQEATNEQEKSVEAKLEPVIKTNPEEIQSENILKITKDEQDEKDTSFEDTKLQLFLDEDAALVSSQDNPVEEIDNEVSSGVLVPILEEMDTTSDKKELPTEDTVIENKVKIDEKKPNVTDVAQDSKHVWVSNIGRSVGAKQLRKYFGKCGMVQTVKVLTNGRLFYGYILMATAEDATKCIKELNNTICEGYVLHVSKNRPEIIRVPTENVAGNKTKSRGPKRSFQKSKLVVKKTENKITQSEVENKTKKHDEGIAKDDKDKKTISELERKLKEAHSDLSRMKRRLDECERRKLLSEINARREMDKIRLERRHLNRDKESFEKIKKAFQKRMGDDKASVMKELDEVKALRVKLQNRLDNFVRVNRKSRSPSSRSHRNPPDSTLTSDERKYRERERNTLKRKKVTLDNTAGTVICPPSPPILTNYDRRGSQRTDQFRSNSANYSGDRKHANIEKSLSYRGRLNSHPSRENRNSYPATYTNENSRYSNLQVQPFTRYGNAVSDVQPIPGTSRAGYNHYLPPYSHY